MAGMFAHDVKGGSVMVRQNKWEFPKELEIIKCREGSKEFMKERANKRSGRDQYAIIAEFPLFWKTPDESEARKIWNLARRVAHDFLKTDSMPAAIITHLPPSESTGRTFDCVCVYGKFLSL